MTITNRVSLKSVMAGNTPIDDVPDAPTIGTATATGQTTATVTYTAAATGGTATTFTATSTPGSITGTGSSPITVSGLTGGTAYTFTVRGSNSTGTSPESSASSLITTDPGPGTRGLFSAGNATNRIDYFDISTTGNATTFGQLTVNRSHQYGTVASTSRAIFAGGHDGSNFTKIIDYVTFANIGNATSFGNMITENDIPGGLSNQTRGVLTRGYKSGSGPRANTMEYLTIATLGDTTNFGTIQSVRQSVGVASPTRGVWYIGFGNSNEYINNIDYITIATTGNGTNFGTSGGPGGNQAPCSSDTRGVFFGGFGPSGLDVVRETIWYLTIATTGNATFFGNLTSARQDAGACSTNTRGVTGGGRTPTNLQIMEYITIATTGNTVSFGNMTLTRSGGPGSSNGHGGLM